MKQYPTQNYQNFNTPKTIYGNSNRNLLRIIDFYLFNCPTPGRSYRGKDFNEYGFRGRAAFGVLKKKLLESSTKSLQNNYYPCKKEDLENYFKRVALVSPPDEYCVFLKNDDQTVMASLFTAIRNAFAHGSYNVKKYNGTRIYFFVNFKGYKKAQLVLHEETLLAWINIIQSGY